MFPIKQVRAVYQEKRRESTVSNAKLSKVMAEKWLLDVSARRSPVTGAILMAWLSQTLNKIEGSK